MQTISQKFLLLFLSLFIGTAYLILNSNTSPSVLGYSDSSVFLTMGFSWTENIIPYRDIFDHKGPVLYILNALGFIICDEFYGVLLIETIFLSVSIIIFYLLCDTNKYSFFIAYLFIAFYFKIVFEYGNVTEEYAITLNLITIFIFTKQYSTRFYSYGLLGGLLFLLRPNLAAPALAVCLIDLIHSRNHKIVINIAKSATGLLVTLLPILLYFYWQNGLRDFIESFLLFNFKYTTLSEKSFLHIEINHIIKRAKFYVPLAVLFILIARKDLVRFTETIAIFLFSLLMSAISGRDYLHYFMVIIPSMAFTLSTVIKLYNTDALIINFFSRNNYLNEFKKRFPSGLRILRNTIYLLICILGFFYTYKIYSYLNTEKLQSIRDFFYQNGITQTSSILNLANHSATKIFYILKIPPREKDFFPETATITGKYTESMKQDTLLCPQGEYDIIVIPQNKKFYCPQYSRFDTPLNNLKIYKKNVQ